MAASKDWTGIDSAYKAELESFAVIWEQQTGYHFNVTDAILAAIAKAGNVFTERDLARALMAYVPTGFGTWNNMPWAAYGIDSDTYRASVLSFGSIYRQLTGQAADPATSYVDAALAAGMTAGEYQQMLMSDAAMQEKFGWLKHGLNYEEFKMKKAEYRISFGAELSDAQAISQLTYLHATQGADRSAAVKPLPSRWQTDPAAVGISESTVR